MKSTKNGDIISNAVVRVSELPAESPAHQVRGSVTSTSLRDGPSWIREIYDHPARVLKGSFGKVR